MSGRAEILIRDHLIGCLPPGVPPSFRRIVSACFDGVGHKRKAVGHMEMFDGRPATVEVFQWAPNAWGHRWSDMPGGACSWEGSCWVRCDDEGNILPAQMALAFTPPAASEIERGRR
ncbi:hypothetical protein [Methylorubrum zatmanii]